MLAWPLRMPTLAWLGGMAAASILVQLSAVISPILGAVLSLAWWVMAFKLASEALGAVAAGREGDAGYEHVASDGVALRQLVLGVVLVVAGALCWQAGGRGAAVFFAAIATLAVPAIVVVLVLEESVRSALDPRNWWLLLRGVGTDYLVVAAQIAGLALAVGLALAATPLLPPGLRTAVAHGLVLYALLAAYHALGVLIDRHRDALAGPDEAPVAAPEQATHEERAAVREASRLHADGQPAEAAAVLDRLIRGRGATAAVHAQYRAMLGGLGDHDALQAHARTHVATLLHLEKSREALALYHDARRRDPGFELAEPQDVGELIAVAARNQQAQLAVALAEEFLRRFPRDRDVMQHGLLAASLMADRLGREADADALLRRLLAARPDHPLAPDLEAALLAIGPRR